MQLLIFGYCDSAHERDVAMSCSCDGCMDTYPKFRAWLKLIQTMRFKILRWILARSLLLSTFARFYILAEMFRSPFCQPKETSVDAWAASFLHRVTQNCVDKRKRETKSKSSGQIVDIGWTFKCMIITTP